MRRFLIPTLAFLASALAFVVAQATHEEDPVVLRLGSTTETLSEFEGRFEIAIRSMVASQGAQMTDEIRGRLEGLKPAYLDQRAQEVVLVDEAEERGLRPDPADVDAQVEQVRAGFEDDAAFEQLLSDSGIGDESLLRQLIRENLMIQALYEDVRDAQEIGDDELRTAYVDRRDQFARGAQACASHILLESVEDAEAVLAELEDGADFAELAAERSTGPSAEQGGDLGCFTRERMVAPFADAAFEAEVGTPVGPVETEFGQHVILVREKREAATASFEEVQEQLRSTLLQEAADREIGALVDGSGVVTYPDRVPTPEPPQDGAAPGGEAPASDGDGAASGD
jgi:peptidyl-prolyl cis-trans isomerase C